MGEGGISPFMSSLIFILFYFFAGQPTDHGAKGEGEGSPRCHCGRVLSLFLESIKIELEYEGRKNLNVR